MTKDNLGLILNEIGKIDDKVDTLQSDLSDIKLNIEKNTNDLDYHIKRTALNEARLEALQEQLKPLSSWYNTIGNILKIFGAVGIVVAAFSGTWGALKALFIKLFF